MEKNISEDKKVIIQINVNWDIPKQFITRFNQALKFSEIPKRLGYIIEDIENSFIQIWESHEKLLETLHEKEKINAKFGEILYHRNNFQKLLQSLERIHVHPIPFPEEGLVLTYNLVQSHFPDDIPIENFLFYRKIDLSIKFEEILPHQKFKIIIPTKEALAKFLCVLNPDLVKTFIKIV